MAPIYVLALVSDHICASQTLRDQHRANVLAPSLERCGRTSRPPRCAHTGALLSTGARLGPRRYLCGPQGPRGTPGAFFLYPRTYPDSQKSPFFGPFRASKQSPALPASEKCP